MQTSFLPIELTDGFFLDNTAASACGAAKKDEYNNANPFPHIVIDHFLPDTLINKILVNFPKKPVKSEVNFEIGYAGHHKRQIPPLNCNEFNRNLFAFLNSEPMLKFLENMTGIEKLIPDPYFTGGGYHEISRGGLLGIHADFRINKELNLNRRLNMLIYLNEDWQDEWGGCLELWDQSMEAVQRSVMPVVNRCVVFNTDQDSFHGHPDALNCPDNVTRKSIALYYYTASENIYDEIPAHDTMYKARPSDSAALKTHAFKLRLNNYINDWLPPVLARLVMKIKYRLIKS
jgi:Rps23 Pro-64 3,4-dihydroxylase Tpa1-like proline 4-hydroxylase